MLSYSRIIKEQSAACEKCGLDTEDCRDCRVFTIINACKKAREYEEVVSALRCERCLAYRKFSEENRTFIGASYE